jgi:integrase
MARRLLTTRAVEAAQPKRNAAGVLVRNEIADGLAAGLYLSVEPTGTKSWVQRYRDAEGKSKRRKLGDVGAMSLLAARSVVAAVQDRREREPDAVPAVRIVTSTDDRIEPQAAQFMERYAYRKMRKSTAETAERIFNRLILPVWRGRSVQEIKRRDVITLVEQIASERGGYMANRTLGHLSKFFNWLCSRDVIQVSPVSGVERPHVEEVRQRTLSDAELRALWLACEGDGSFGDALKVLMLTGARRNEVSQMKWDEIGGSKWTLPKERSKNAREHVTTLSAQVRAIIEAQPRFVGCSYVFSADGRRPITGWAKAKTRLSAKAEIAEASWRLHDLRRTCASGMQRLGVRTEAIERALNHRSGIFRGLVGVYQTDR